MYLLNDCLHMLFRGLFHARHLISIIFNTHTILHVSYYNPQFTDKKAEI